MSSPVGLRQKDTTWTKIFVGGLPFTTSDETLRKFFEPFGSIEEAVVITDRNTGKSKGYGFVIMETKDSAARACEQPNPIIDGRKANVNLAFLGAKPRANIAETPRGNMLMHLNSSAAQPNQMHQHDSVSEMRMAMARQTGLSPQPMVGVIPQTFGAAQLAVESSMAGTDQNHNSWMTASQYGLYPHATYVIPASSPQTLALHPSHHQYHQHGYDLSSLYAQQQIQAASLGYEHYAAGYPASGYAPASGYGYPVQQTTAGLQPASPPYTQSTTAAYPPAQQVAERMQ